MSGFPWNIRYPVSNDEMINLDWILNKVKELDKSMDELEERVLAAALAATKEYVDTQMAAIISDFNDLSREVANLRLYFDEKIDELQGDYDTFVLSVRNELDRMTNRITAFETTVQNEIIGVNALTDLKIEQNNEYILDRVAEGLVNVKVLNYFTGELVTIQNMFDYLAQLHLDNPISYNELDSAAIDYDTLIALNMTYTELAVKGKSFIIP